MTRWDDIFKPVLALGREPRAGQATLGQGIIDVIEEGGSLLAQASTGTGKSFAVLVPMIHKVIENKKEGKPFRCVVSTETLTLQNQLIRDDLPFLSTLYSGFKYRKLMGRSNYVCLESASIMAKGNMTVAAMVEKLKRGQSRLGEGELSDAEKVLGREIEPQEWEKLAGSSKFCSDNQCKEELCYSTRARNLAMKADIVVVNHAILAVDIEMKVSAGGGAFADGMLGQFEVLAVDEAHKLEDVLKEQWKKTLTDWELQDKQGSILTAIDKGRSWVSHSTIGDDTAIALDGLQEMMTNIQLFFHRLSLIEGTPWKKYETALSEKYLSRGTPEDVIRAMTEYEEENPKRLEKVLSTLEKALNYLKRVQEYMIDEQIKGLRDINKGIRACKDIIEFAEICTQALATKDGIVQQYGAFGAVVSGWERRNGDRGMTVTLTPLDVSARAKYIWAGAKSKILLSATLIDLTEMSFRYVKASLGFPEGKEIVVETPFSLDVQQRIYVTKGEGEKAEKGQYSFNELVDLMLVSKGRALVLFTSREELDWAADMLKRLQIAGHFPYTIYVQEKDSNKQKLAKSFKEDVHSVLLATRSFFTGFDAPGETVTLVALAKWTLPRYSVSCKQEIKYWAGRQFPKWYERKSLEDLHQASGRLIRSSNCRGVVAILDFRAYDTSSNVYKIARQGVLALGSPVTQKIEDVAAFLG